MIEKSRLGGGVGARLDLHREIDECWSAQETLYRLAMQEAGAGALCVYLRHGYCESSYKYERFGGFGPRYVTIDYKSIPWYYIVPNRGI